MNVATILSNINASLAILLATTAGVGTVRYVSNVGSVGANNLSRGGAAATPYATIDYAVGQCTVGDTIVVLPGHVETVSTANGLDFDVAGIKVVFLGEGDNRASVNLTATAATIRINANNVHIVGMQVTGGIDAVALCVDVNGKTGVRFTDLRYRDVTGQCTVFFKAANNSDRLTIDGVRVIGDSAAGATSYFQFDGCDDLLLLGKWEVVGNCSGALIDFITTASARVHISGNDWMLWNQNSSDLCIKDTITGTTGNVTGTLNLRLTDNAANITESITAASLAQFGSINVCNLAGEISMQINTTASTDA